jgi:hypothetical protein
MNYIKLWLTAYINPRRFADELRTKPAPKWGFFAALQRGLMDSLFTYLPVWLGIVLSIIGIAASLPFAIMFMRSPI